MADKKEGEKAEKAEKKEVKKPEAKKDAAVAEIVHNHEDAEKKRVKSRWTIELCKKAAKRFRTSEEWAAGAPASFKAATARGWDKECAKTFRKETYFFENQKPAVKKPARGRTVA